MLTRVFLLIGSIGLLLGASACEVGQRVMDMQRQNMAIAKTLDASYGANAEVGMRTGANGYFVVSVTFNADKLHGLSVDELKQHVSKVVLDEIKKEPDELVIVLRMQKATS